MRKDWFSGANVLLLEFFMFSISLVEFKENIFVLRENASTRIKDTWDWIVRVLVNWTISLVIEFSINSRKIWYKYDLHLRASLADSTSKFLFAKVSNNTLRMPEY